MAGLLQNDWIIGTIFLFVPGNNDARFQSFYLVNRLDPNLEPPVAGNVGGHHQTHVRKTKGPGSGVFIQGVVVSGGK
ncbi:hypothetical protein [Pseudomonas fluorescens]|uniref:hypothetical protein n=1 Tax=Pseudomonas fluorescens TaxID=294 RepID=UPI0015EB30D1|nr:hypothetical protein [Pseudomonas fluorescens]